MGKATGCFFPKISNLRTGGLNMRPLRIAIVSSHPIQYNAPFFRLLALQAAFEPKVFYTWSQTERMEKYDPGFGKKIEWDIPLLEGYEYAFVPNIATDPGTHHFRGMINPGLIEEIARWQADAVLIYGWSFDSHLKCMGHFHRKIPVLFRGDSTLLDERPGIRKWIRRMFLKWVYTHVDYALYAGTENRKYFLKHGLNSGQLIFAPHAVDNNRFAAPHEMYVQQAKIWRHELGISDDDVVILFAGKMEPKKDPLLILQIAGMIKDEKIKFLFVGNGVLEQELKTKAGNDKRILFLDFQNQQKMPVVYRLGDIFILPSKGPGETWGLSVNEAMACGKPVLVSDRCGCAADLVINGRNGYVFSATDKADLAEKMVLMNDREQLRKMGDESVELIKNFSYANIVRGIEKAVGNQPLANSAV